MRAAVCREHGSPAEVVSVADVPEPGTDGGRVVVEVHAASVNFTDVLLCRDAYQVKVPTPFVVGSEFAGVVVDAPTGAAVSAGDRVAGATLVGAFAERVAVAAASLRPVPPALSDVEAAAAGVVTETAYHALRSVAAVRSGEWVVVLGAAGGVGLSAVDLAVLLGARVIAAASSAEKLELCRRRGAEVAIDYTAEDLKTRVKEVTSGGADVVIDPVGGDVAEAALRALRWGGRYVTLGYASGTIPRFPLNLVLLKGVRVEGMEFASFVANSPELAARDRAELDALFADGQGLPYVSHCFALADTSAALTALESRSALGKLVISPIS